MDQISEMWAKVLLDVAIEEGEVEKIKDEVDRITPLFDDDFLRFLKAPKITKEDKKAMIDMISDDHIIKNFLKLIIDKGRTSSINSILRCFRHLYLDHKHIKEVRVITARSIDDDLKSKLITSLKRKLDSEVILSEEIDERLLSGIKVIIDDKVIDVSMQKKIKDLRRTLLESW